MISIIKIDWSKIERSTVEDWWNLIGQEGNISSVAEAGLAVKKAVKNHKRKILEDHQQK
jgi:DNA polymerase elongation subunit (family B)